MANRFNLVYDGHPVMALAPANDSAGRSGVWVNAAFSHKIYVMVDIAQGASTGVPLTFQQATSAAGANAKAVSANMSIWADQAAGSGDTLVQQPSAENFTTSSATGNKKIIFEVIPESVLDVNNGFNHIQVITGASASGNATAASYFILPGRYEQAVPPSALS